MNKLNILLGSLFLIVLGLGIYIVYLNSSISSSSDKRSQPTGSTSKNALQITTTPIQKPIGGFIYTTTGFTPQRLRFRSTHGIDIIFTNSSSKQLTIESETAELNSVIPPTASTTVTISKIGAYSFHNKTAPAQKATFELIP